MPGAPRASVVWLVLGAMLGGCAQGDPRVSSLGLPPVPWVSRAILQARGDIAARPHGKRQALRYAGWTTKGFGRYRTYAYGDSPAAFDVVAEHLRRTERVRIGARSPVRVR